MAAKDFIKDLSSGAQKVYKKYNVLASLVIAQGCLESGFGESGLAKSAKNLFGVKGTYNGKYVLMWTYEQDKRGNVTRIQAKFRKYPSYTQSLEDLGSLYTRLSRYKAVVGEKNYKKACQAVKDAGYATDINYPSKLINIIETYNLTQYDDIANVPDDPDVPDNPDTDLPFPSKEDLGSESEKNENLPKDTYFNQIFVASKDGKDLIEIIGTSIDMTDNAEGKKDITFNLIRTTDNQAEFNLLVPDNVIYLDEKVHKHQKYFITDVDLKQDENGTVTKSIKASHVFVLLINKRNDDVKPITKKMKIKEALDIALKDTRFTYVLKDSESKFPEIEQENFGDKNSSELLSQIIEDYEAELDVDNYKIIVYKKMGKTIDHTLDSRVNMKGINVSFSTKNSTTRAWGYGAMKENKTASTDDKDKEKPKEPEYLFEPILYIHPDEDKYLLDGEYRWGEPLKDETIKKPSTMLSKLKKHVNPFPEITVEIDYVNVFDEELLDIQEEFWKGDTLHIIADTGYGITYESDVRLIEIQYNPLNPYSSPKLIFSNTRRSIVDYQLNATKKILETKKYFDDVRLADFTSQ